MSKSARNKKPDPDAAFEAVQKMLQSLAWRAKMDPKWPFEDAYSEACLAFMSAYDKYDPDRGMKFSSWVFFKARLHLRKCRKEVVNDPHVYCEITEKLGGVAPGYQKAWIEMLDDLSSDAREIVSLLIETPRDILSIMPVPREPEQLLAKVCEELGFEKGWDTLYQEITVHEIRAKFEGSY